MKTIILDSFFSDKMCFMAAIVVMLCSNPVFMLIGNLAVGRAEKNRVAIFLGVKAC